jgi:hypothetical protein
MHSPRHGQWFGLLATLDTGTTENWITQTVVDRLGLIAKNGLITQWTTLNGQEVSSGSTVNPTWCRQGQDITHVADFRVVSTGPFDIIFGRNILSAAPFNDSDVATNTVLICGGDEKANQPQERNKGAGVHVLGSEPVSDTLGGAKKGNQPKKRKQGPGAYVGPNQTVSDAFAQNERPLS